MNKIAGLAVSIIVIGTLVACFLAKKVYSVLCVPPRWTSNIPHNLQTSLSLNQQLISLNTVCKNGYITALS